MERAYGGTDNLNLILGSHKKSINNEGLRYIPKKGRNAFVPQMTTFIKGCDKTCHKCHKVGHVKKDCPSNKNVSFTSNASYYSLTKNAKGVCAKVVGTPKIGAKKSAIWVPKALVTNVQGPKQIWVPERN